MGREWFAGLGQKLGRLVQVAVGVSFIKCRHELSPYEIRLANAEAAVVLVIKVRFLDRLNGQPGNFVQAELYGGVQPDFGWDRLGNAGAETIT